MWVGEGSEKTIEPSYRIGDRKKGTSAISWTSPEFIIWQDDIPCMKWGRLAWLLSSKPYGTLRSSRG